jgi:hypothetical protein
VRPEAGRYEDVIDRCHSLLGVAMPRAWIPVDVEKPERHASCLDLVEDYVAIGIEVPEKHDHVPRSQLAVDRGSDCLESPMLMLLL